MKRKQTPEDMHLWEIHVKDVKPLHKQKKKPIQVVSKSQVREKSPSQPLITSKSKPNSLGSQPFQVLSRKELRKVNIDARLDMHGMSLEEGHQALENFLKWAQEKGFKTILVITGKGALTSENTLRHQLPRWLQETPLRELIISFQNPVKPQHGGPGAFYVHVRKK